jgi:hypothetical protein
MAVYHVLGNSILTTTEFRVKAAEEAERAKLLEADVAAFAVHVKSGWWHRLLAHVGRHKYVPDCRYSV